MTDSTPMFDEILRLMREFTDLAPRKENILVHPTGMRKIRDVSEKYETPTFSPFPNIKILEADWLKTDELYMGPPEVIAELVKIGELYGGEIARELLLKICGVSEPDTP